MDRTTNTIEKGIQDEQKPTDYKMLQHCEHLYSQLIASRSFWNIQTVLGTIAMSRNKRHFLDVILICLLMVGEFEDVDKQYADEWARLRMDLSCFALYLDEVHIYLACKRK